MTTIISKFLDALVVLRRFVMLQLVAGTPRLWKILQSYPRCILVTCIVITIICFAKLEAAILASERPYWWSWFDQGKYLESAFALAAGDLSPQRHHYPIGYALAAAPFTYLVPDPFIIVNMLCLIGSLWAFMRICDILGIGYGIGGIIFLATSVLTYSICLHYVIPWTSTPTAFLILAGLMLGLLSPTYWRAFMLGLIPGLIALIKPVDAIALVPLAIYYSIVCRRAPPPGSLGQRAYTGRLLGFGAIGVIAGSAIAIVAHWLINGWTLSHYESVTTEGTVFILRSLPYKLYSLFVDPTVIYGNYLGTKGIFERYPWVFIGTCGMILTLFRDVRLAVVALCTAAYVAMYAAYYDMIPNNLWHYNSIHYYTWCFPIFGLFAFALVRQLLVQPSVADTVIVLAASVSLLAWHPVLRPVAATVVFEDKNAASIQLTERGVPFAIDLDGEPGAKNLIYFGKVKVRWDGRSFLPGHESRAIPIGQGTRILLFSAAPGHNLTISWDGLGIVNVRGLVVFSLNWAFL